MSGDMEKIAVIEDDPGIRTVIRLALKGAGLGAFLLGRKSSPAFRARSGMSPTVWLTR